MLKRSLLTLILLLTTVSSFPIIQSEKDLNAVEKKFGIALNIFDKHIKDNGLDKTAKAYAKDLEIIIDDIIDYKEGSFDNSLEAKKDLSILYLVRASLRCSQGEYHEGLMDCGRALRLDKDNGAAYWCKALIWRDLGDQIKSDRSMRIAAEKGSNEAKEYILAYS